MHLNKKGIAIKYIIGMLIGLVGILIAIKITTMIGGESYKSADKDCLIYNSFKNMAGDSTANFISNQGACKPDKITISNPDLSSGDIYSECRGMMPNPDNYRSSRIASLNDANNFIDKCVAYQLMEQVEKCWANYLLGSAEWDATCSKICLANGYSSYFVTDRLNEEILPNIENAKLYYYPGDFDKNKLTYELIRELTPLNDVRLKQDTYFEKIEIISIGNVTKVKTTTSRLSSRDFSIVMELPISVNSKYLGVAGEVIDLEEGRTGTPLKEGKFKLTHGIIESGDEWQVDYTESIDLYAGTVVGGAITLLSGGILARVALPLGMISDSYGAFGYDTKISLNEDDTGVGMKKIGVC